MRGDRRREVRDSPEAECGDPAATSPACTPWSGASSSPGVLLATSNAAYADLGLTLSAATSQNEAPSVELLAGNPVAAET